MGEYRDIFQIARLTQTISDRDVEGNVQRNLFGVSRKHQIYQIYIYIYLSNIMVIPNSGLPNFRDIFRGIALWQWSLGSCVFAGKSHRGTMDHLTRRCVGLGKICGASGWLKTGEVYLIHLLSRGFDGMIYMISEAILYKDV